MNKVLITGITGLVGSAFAVESLKRDADLTFVAITRPKGSDNAADRVKEAIIDQCNFDGTPEIAEDLCKRIDVIEGDVSDPVHLAMSHKLEGISSVFHCAADVNLGVDAEGKTFHVNYNGTKVLLQIAKELKVESFHYVSTAYVAGKTKGKVMEDSMPATEWHNSYEHSKYESEKLVRSSGIPFTIYRPSIIVGRSTDGKIRKPLAFYFILEFLAVLKERNCAKKHVELSDWLDMPLRMHAKVTDTIFFVPIDYISNVITHVFPMPAVGKTYHLTGNSPVSTQGIEEAISQTLKVKNVTLVDELPNPTMDEKLLHRFLGEFLPYFGSEALFDVSNIVEIFGKESVEWGMVGEKLVQMVGSYYTDNFPELTDVVV
jgi:nucleoside-diphosphate-sugar epimerase